MSNARFGWYLRRLRGMSATEVANRTLDAGRRRAWARRQVRRGQSPALPADLLPERAFVSSLSAATRETVAPDAASALISAADKVLAGTWTVLGAPRADSADPDWFHDPVTGRRSPDGRLTFRINHRDEAETGNIKQVWEMSRHHHVTVLEIGRAHV